MSRFRVGPQIFLVLSACHFYVDQAEAQSDAAGKTPVFLGTLAVEQVVQTLSDAAYGFDGLSNLAVNTDGIVFVSDRYHRVIRVFSPSGEEIGSIGGIGEGVGEFNQIDGISIGPMDSLLAWDLSLGRLTVFEPGYLGLVAYSVPLSYAGQAVPIRTHKYRPGGFLSENLPLATRLEQTSYDHMWLDWVDRDGAVKADSIHVYPAEEFHIVRSDVGETHAKLPFGRRPIIRVGRDGTIYYTWTGQYQIWRLSVADDPVELLSLRIDDLRVSATEKDLAKRQLQSRFLMSDVGDTVSELVPRLHPALEDFHVDDDGRFWTRMPTADDSLALWWVVDLEGGYREVRLPRSFAVLAIRNDRLYGLLETENGNMTLAIYLVTKTDDP